MFIFVLTHCRKFRKYKKRKEENKNHPRVYHPDTTLINISGCCPVNHTLRNTCVLYDMSDWGLVFRPFRIFVIQHNHFSFMYNLVKWLSVCLQTCTPCLIPDCLSTTGESGHHQHSLPAPSPALTSSSTSCLWLCLFWTLHTNGITLRVAFCVCSFPLSMFLGPITYVFTHASALCFSVWLRNHSLGSWAHFVCPLITDVRCFRCLYCCALM